MKKIILFITVLALSVLLAGQVYGAQSFSDINSHWAKDSITTAVSKGYVDGYPDGTFKPDANVTRAEFIKLAVDAMGYKKSISTSSGSAWYGTYLDAAIANGLSEKGEFTDFDGAITRDEMSRIAVRGTGQANYDPLKWMYLATSKGIINGMDDQGTLGEDQPTTRAQAITVIERILKLKAGEKLPTDKYATSAAEIVWHKTNILTMAPQYFGAGAAQGNEFNTKNLRYDGANGYSEIEKYVVVDMGDPNDPNKKLIPDGMRWMGSKGKDSVILQDVPTNAFAFLNFNHIKFETSVDLRHFHFAWLTTPAVDSFADSIGDDGELTNTVNFAPYSEKNHALLNSDLLSVTAGSHDIRYITGQLVPKNNIAKQGMVFPIRREPAQELGEKSVSTVYTSYVDYNLGGN
ncbi:hypothetical protein GC093_25350 [Paenibacillus sp. LMG 31456]|uniref:SLH domain-containing protein n=1 Tax=Paenibacillus foliorum TaxID=2654974 RepID=A0A972K1B2_9BACL|nr:S-layer homology domain-containing protein [Paenibacillus foliorum]NOU96519.1 hypothetical protein [Paenibacillus foliorum]